MAKILDAARYEDMIQLCDCTNWDEETNIGSKCLRIMRLALEISKKQDFIDFKMFNQYEKTALVIKKLLKRVHNKVESNV